MLLILEEWSLALLLGTVTTLSVTVAALSIGVVIGTCVASLKLSRTPVYRLIGALYSFVFRGVPDLLIIYVVYFSGGRLLTNFVALFGYDGLAGLNSFAAGAIAAGMISGAYQAEIFRFGYLAIAPGEIEAAAAIGMPRVMRLRRIIIPQVLRLVIPGMGNIWQLGLKDSALISVTGLAELMRVSQLAAGSTRRYFLFFISAGRIYLAVTVLSDFIFKVAEDMSDKTMPSRR